MGQDAPRTCVAANCSAPAIKGSNYCQQHLPGQDHSKTNWADKADFQEGHDNTRRANFNKS